MKWKSKELGKGSIAYADGMLYLRSEDGKGTVALVEATPDGWREKGRFDQPDRSGQNSWSHPVIANGRLYLRDMDVLLAYDVKAP
jgi:outer membrane protein assembly factor BamB